MKKMILFLIVGVVAVFLQLYNRGGLLVDFGIFLGLVGIIMAMERVKPMDRAKPFIERLKRIKAKEKRKIRTGKRIRGRPGVGGFTRVRR